MTDTIFFPLSRLILDTGKKQPTNCQLTNQTHTHKKKYMKINENKKKIEFIANNNVVGPNEKKKH